MEQISFTSKYVTWADAKVVLMAVSVDDCSEVAIGRGMPGIDQDQVNNYAALAGISQMDSATLKCA